MRLFLIAAAALMSVGLVHSGDAGDAKMLQGAWALTELVVGGTKVPDKEIQGMKFIFEGNKLTIAPPASDTGVVDKRTFTFKLDPSKKPAEVDITALDGKYKDTVSPGIYELKGDTLRWCQSDDPKAKDRPKDFASPEKSPLYLFTFKRAK